MTGRSEILSFHTIRAKFLAFVVPLVLLSTIAVFGSFEFNARRDANLKLHDKLDKLVAIQSAVMAESLWDVAEVRTFFAKPAIANYYQYRLYPLGSRVQANYPVPVKFVANPYDRHAAGRGDRDVLERAMLDALSRMHAGR